MNQPTREEFEALRAQVQRLEQATEPIRITDTVLLQTLVTMAGTNATDMALLKGEMGVLKQTVERIEQKADGVVSIGQRAEADTNKLRQLVERRFDAIADVQKLILARLPEKGE